MFRNYIKTGWRNIRKNGFQSFINVFGLSVGVLFTLLIASYVYNELRINKNLKNAGNHYFLLTEWKDPNLGADITTIAPLAKRLKEDYPNLVANYYRWDGITSVVSKGDKHFREGIQLGDSTILSMFGFELLQGNPQTALNEPFTTVISQDVAIKYFGKTNVVGETISIQNFAGASHEFMITGVLKKIPENSVTHLNSENHNTFFIPTNTYTYFGRLDFENWANTIIPAYIELKQGVSPSELERPIRQLINQNANDIISQNLNVKPIALTKYYLEKDNALVKRMLYTLAFVGLFILAMAIINFINISVSSSSKRVKEIGMRKVMGGLQKEIVWQFLIESIIIVCIATLFAFLSYPIASRFFGELIGKSIPPLLSFPFYYLLIPFLFVLVIGLMAGLYPAFVLSSLNSIESLKGKLKNVKENVLLRKSLMGFQFCIAAIVLISSFVVTEQVAHFFSQKLGYNKEFVVAAQVPRDWTPAGVKKMETIRNEFGRTPNVNTVSLSYEIPNGMNGNQPAIYKYGTDSTKAIAMQALVSDGNYLNTYQIPLKAGSFFQNDQLDSSKIVLNEQAVKAFGWQLDDAIGQRVKIPNDNVVYTVQGITNDFHFTSMHQKIEPIVFFHVRKVNAYRFLSFKINPGNISEAIQSIQNKWAALLPGSSFEYKFMDDTLRKMYASEVQLKKAAYTSAVLSLIIVLLGVLGLLSLSVQKRTKEIGIRKVLGASSSNIISLFLKEFLPVLLIGGLISIPIAWNVMQNWLNNYVYRVPLTFQPFLIAIGLLGVITTVVISLQIGRAAAVNPVKNMRVE